MRILVTGGSGLVGRYVVDELVRSHDVEVLDLRPLHRKDVPLHLVDILTPETVRTAVKGFDAVVHLAGIPHPLSEPAEKVFRVNTLGTFNVLEACTFHQVRKFIFLSSESTLGFAFSSTRIWPTYLPIDEEHPTHPQDPYGLSKLASELLCRGFSERTGMQTICLRPPWIWVPEAQEVATYRELAREYPRWSKNLWAYIHVQDVSEAIRLSLSASGNPPHEFCFICADDNWTGLESRALAREFFPETASIAKTFLADRSFISSAKATRLLGFRPHYSWRDLLG